MQSILNMESCEKLSCSKTDDASLFPKMVTGAGTPRRNATTVAGAASSCSTWQRGWRCALNAIERFTKIRLLPKNSAISTMQSQSAPSLPYQEQAPVKFKLAGADFEASNGQFLGRFHTIPLPLWNAIIGFHRQVSINIRGESVSYHRWSEVEGCYHTLIPYQKSRKHGLAVDVNWNDPRNTEILNEYAKQYGEEFLPACTIHTHVDIAAFESGTDARDEEEAPGWHITLGRLLSADKYDFDFRMRLPQFKALKDVIATDRPFKLTWNNLFPATEGMETFLHTTPGTTDFHHLLNRVDAG